MHQMDPNSRAEAFAASCMGGGYILVGGLVAAFIAFLNWVNCGWWALIMAPLMAFVVFLVPVNLMSLLVTGRSLAEHSDGEGCLMAGGIGILLAFLLVPVMALLVGPPAG